jgi:hypothetical protein
MQYYVQNPIMIRGRVLYFDYSNRSEITATPENRAPLGVGAIGEAPSSGGDRGNRNRILLLNVTNLVQPMSLEFWHHLFSQSVPPSLIEKVVMFNKNGELKTLAQFKSIDAAAKVREALNERNLWGHGNLVSISFSRLTVRNPQLI